MANDTPRDPDTSPSEEPTRPREPSRRAARREAPPERRSADPYDPAAHEPAALRRISWGAVFAGGVVALVLQFALGLLGLGIGFIAFDPADPDGGFAVGAGIWLAVSTIVALFLGGMAAGRLAGMPRREDSMLHGVVMWGLVTLFALLFMTTAVGQVLSVAFGAVGQGVTMMAEEQDMQDATAREMMVDVLATYGDMDREEARQTLEEYEQEVAEADEEAIAEDVTETTARAAIWGFVAMALGAIAAAGGGAVGMPRDLPASAAMRRE